MIAAQESMTAKLCSFARAYHSMLGKNKIFDDYLAYDIIGLYEGHGREEILTKMAERYPDVPAEDKANPDKLRDFILRKDKQRQSYYNYYSMKKWGRADTYDLSIDTSLFGIDGTVNLLTQVIEDFENR